MVRTYRTLNRYFAILNLLERAPHGLVVRDLYERLRDEHPADERTYRRDLENLEYLGYLVSFLDPADEMRANRYRINRTLQAGKPLNLNLRELLALYVARNTLSPLKDTQFYKDLQGVFNKIEKLLGSKYQAHLAELSSEVRFEVGPRWGLGINSTLFDAVLACCNESQLLSVKYKSVSSGDCRTRTLGPHFLYFARGTIYLVAEDMETNEVKIFSLPRMSDAHMLDAAYKSPRVDPEKYFESAFGVYRTDTVEDVKLHFSSSVSDFVRERHWHPTQQIAPQGDGSLIMSLRLGVTPELIQWVLGFGDCVKVAEPKSLREKVISEAKGVLSVYTRKRAA